MKKEIYKAAARGDVEFLKEAKAKDVEAAATVYSDDDLLGLTSQGDNIIHVAALFGHFDFIKAALECFPAPAHQIKLICEANSDGETPLHLAAKQRTQALAEYLVAARNNLPGSPPLPWRIQNNKGNTPLHVALMNGGKSIQVADYLLGVDPEVAAYTNHLKQTPLHLAVIYNTKGTEMSAIQMINSLNSHGAALSTRNSLFVQENKDISLSLVSSLLEKNSEVCCLCDTDGMTPLLRAAVRSNLPVVDAIIKDCPESIKICDPKGKNVLHHIRFSTLLEVRRFLEKPEIPKLLIDQQDDDGNTPMHIAVMNHEFGMVKAMVEQNANFAIENREGVSAQTLFDRFAIKNKLDVSDEAQIESKPNKFLDLVKKENEKEVIIDELMSNDLYEAFGNREWDRLREIMLNDEKQFLSRLPDGSNIIHLAIQGLKLYEFAEDFNPLKSEAYPEEELIVDALEKYPLLFCQTNHLGETPLHLELFHRMWKMRYGTQFDNKKKKIKEEMMKLKGRGELPLPLPPWKIKDVQGNTILHCAIKHRNYEFAKYLIEIDANLAGEVNHFKQTPLHLLCQIDDPLHGPLYHYYFAELIELTKLIVEKDVSTVYSRDVEGFTPLLTAAQHGATSTATEILKQHPQSIRQIDPRGQNYFHKRRWRLCETVPQKEMEVLITQKDDQGNTPFDLAVEKREFQKAQILIECCGDLRGKILEHWLKHHKGSTRVMIYDQQISGKFQKFLKSRGIKLGYDFVLRSTYGVRREDIKEYMNPMGVVAALLATVTFTAAFTVPGG